MATGLGVPELIAEPTDESVLASMWEVGKRKYGESFSVYPLKGTPGNAYTTDRKGDVEKVVRAILRCRVSGSVPDELSWLPGDVTQTLCPKPNSVQQT